MRAGHQLTRDLSQVGRILLACRSQCRESFETVRGYSGRSYLTKQEDIEWFEEYKDNLNELVAVLEN
jgi:hypothetical protein